MFRGDSDFCRWRMLLWCERHRVRYIVGIAKNASLLAQASDLTAEAEAPSARTGKKQRLFGSVYYAAKTWRQARRVIVKAEPASPGA